MFQIDSTGPSDPTDPIVPFNPKDYLVPSDLTDPKDPTITDKIDGYTNQPAVRFSLKTLDLWGWGEKDDYKLSYKHFITKKFI